MACACLQRQSHNFSQDSSILQHFPLFSVFQFILHRSSSRTYHLSPRVFGANKICIKQYITFLMMKEIVRMITVLMLKVVNLSLLECLKYAQYITTTDNTFHYIPSSFSKFPVEWSKAFFLFMEEYFNRILPFWLKVAKKNHNILYIITSVRNYVRRPGLERTS